MKILITGASGFVGSFLVQRALDEGHEVWAAMRKSSSKQYLQDQRIRFIVLNIEDEAQLHEQLLAHQQAHGSPFDGVIHAAAATKAKDEQAFRRANTEGTIHLARQLLNTGMLRGRLVFVSSLAVMGALHEQRLCDAQGKPCQGAAAYRPFQSSDAPQPNTAYGRSKWAAEQALAQMEALDYIVLRPTGVYGPREKDYFLMAKGIQQHTDFAVGYRPQILSFIYVQDLVEACFLALHRGQRGAAYLLSDGGDYNSRDFSLLLQKEMGVKSVLRITAPEAVLAVVCFLSEQWSKLTGKLSALNMDKLQLLKQRNWRCDIAPAQQELGFQPKWNLEKGVAETVAWYKQAGWL